MRRTRVSGVVIFVVLFLGLSSATAGEWRFPVGLAYISGIGDIVDQYEDNLQADGFVTESADGIPVGITFQPYYMLDSGLGIGIGIGPAMLIYGDVDFFNLPVNACLRYSPMSKSAASVYFRAGISYNLASGDYIEDSQVGLLGAVGIEFGRNRAVGFGVEIGYDSSTIELEDRTFMNPYDTKEFEPARFMASVFALF